MFREHSALRLPLPSNAFFSRLRSIVERVLLSRFGGDGRTDGQIAPEWVLNLFVFFEVNMTKQQEAQFQEAARKAATYNNTRRAFAIRYGK